MCVCVCERALTARGHPWLSSQYNSHRERELYITDYTGSYSVARTTRAATDTPPCWSSDQKYSITKQCACSSSATYVTAWASPMTVQIDRFLILVSRNRPLLPLVTLPSPCSLHLGSRITGQGKVLCGWLAMLACMACQPVWPVWHVWHVLRSWMVCMYVCMYGMYHHRMSLVGGERGPSSLLFPFFPFFL